MAAVFDSATDNALVAALEAADADAAVTLLAAVALLDDFARSACSFLTCPSRSAIRASMGLRSVHPAVITKKAKMEAFALGFAHLFVSKTDQTMNEVWRAPVSPDSGLSAYCPDQPGLLYAHVCDRYLTSPSTLDFSLRTIIPRRFFLMPMTRLVFIGNDRRVSRLRLFSSRQLRALARHVMGS